MTEDTTSSDEPQVTFHVKSSSEAKYTLTLPRSVTVLDLKNKLAGSEYADIPAERQRLIYSGRVLKDPDTIDSYKVQDGHTIHMVKSAASNQRQNPAVAISTPTPGTPVGNPAGGTSVPSNLASGPGNNPLAGLTGARYAGLAQLPGAQMFGPDGGMGAPPDPESMASMLSNPQFASTLNEALSSPQFLDMLIQQNPMLRDMGPLARQMMQSDEFRRLMTDPNALRQMSQMSRALGVGPFGSGGQGTAGFPAPGVTDTTPASANTAAGGSTPQTNTTAESGADNAGATGNNPAMYSSLLNALANGLQGGGSGPAAAAAAAGSQNPFAALFNPPNRPGATAIPGPGSTNPNETTPQQGASPAVNLAGPGNPFLQAPDSINQLIAALTNPNHNPNDPPSTNPAANNNPFPFLFPGGLGGAGGAGGTAATPPPPADNRPPEERYEQQLRQLNEMGFYEFERNVEALRRSGGSVNGAVEYLLTH
ncbi:MAG: hypothetical protein M1816_005667 [Peltula sp. TS41687]|nr:MAG: hypothetical protein M1816_005667 [Peltula sp. TS41687]